MAVFLLYDDAASLPFSRRLIEHIQKKDANKFESFENVALMCFDFLDIADINRETSKITICQTAERLYFILEDRALLEPMMARVKPDLPPDKELYTFFASLMRNDLDAMEDLEERITDMEDVLLKDNRSDYTLGIIAFRKELLRLRKYYDQLTQLFDGILENENRFIADDDLRYFRFLDQRADRLLAHIVNLRDYITQVREAYQAQIDIEQNRLMKIFTVVTSIFLPLTLIAGWYGMNLKMPETGWDFGYPYVIALSAAVVGVMVFIFKKNKWF